LQVAFTAMPPHPLGTDRGSLGICGAHFGNHYTTA